MGKKKESKPLLSNPGQSSTQHTLIVKKITKGHPGKVKLTSVSEVETGHGSKEKNPKDKCLEKDVDESGEKPYSHTFGVRSYLHNFYESMNPPVTPGQDEEEEYRYLIHPKAKGCGALCFKIGLIVGATLFLLGAVAIVIGYAIPKQRVILGRSGDLEVVDNEAHRFNENLDRCKLIGLAGFCSGGLVLVISLLAPTFTSTYWEDDPAVEPFRVGLSGSLLTEAEPKSPSPIPVTEKIKCIQPVWTE